MSPRIPVRSTPMAVVKSASHLVHENTFSIMGTLSTRYSYNRIPRSVTVLNRDDTSKNSWVLGLEHPGSKKNPNHSKSGFFVMFSEGRMPPHLSDAPTDVQAPLTSQRAGDCIDNSRIAKIENLFNIRLLFAYTSPDRFLPIKFSRCNYEHSVKLVHVCCL